MPIATIQTPDGRTARIEVPVGSTEEQILGFAKQELSNISDVSEAAARKSPLPTQEPKDTSLVPSFLDFRPESEKKKQSELMRKDPEKFTELNQQAAIKGFNQGVFDIGDGLKQMSLEAGEFVGAVDEGVADQFTAEVQAERKSYEETYGLFNGAKVTRFLGNNAPLAMIPVKLPPSLLMKVGVSSGFGAAIGGTQFVEKGGSRGLNTAVGATAGAAFPLALTGLSKTLLWAKNIAVDPFTKKGMYKDVAKFLRKEISENRPKIEAAIKASILKGESKSIAQIIAETTQGTKNDFGGMLVRLEADLSRESDVLKSLYASQSKSRVDFIDSIAGTEDDLIRALKTRTSKAQAAYNESYKIPITADSKLKKIGQNDFFKIAWRDAQKIAQVEGVTPQKNLTKYLHYVKESLDKQLNATDGLGKTALGREELKAVQKVKDNLVKWMGKKNPVYDAARVQYQADSVPVNRMELGLELKKALSNSLDKERPSMFAGAVQDAKKTIKKATGFSGNKKFVDILTKEEVKGLDLIKRELVVDAQKAKMASKSTPVLKELSGEVSVSLPHILSRPIVITNHILKSLGRDRTPAYKKLLINIVRDPNEFLKAYKLPQSDKRAKMAIDIVNRMNTIAATQATINESTLEGQQ